MVYVNENKTKSITQPCWNIYWVSRVWYKVESSYAANLHRYYDAQGILDKGFIIKPDGEVGYYREKYSGTRYFKWSQMDAKRDSLEADPDVMEIYIVHHDPKTRMVRDDAGEWQDV